ncbi:MAG: ECF transporter S component [Armatimonadota bacterium]|nr:ECF transporter S component [Armatimonadota bacterium]MDR7437487.1 ECF transporter S component [Armatimonadota bacterium]MDR7506349.1 ECF transporter S component [Armatimonadota bacterium]MDR7508436.1 ECF transporter S component [Armatimonadota bacterium]MDR7516146.1 ECF transporter S component [Armatimonadota bacterium]
MAQPGYAPSVLRKGFRLSARDISVTGALGAVAAVLGYVPGLGFIPAPTPAGAATTMHIPAIIAGVLEGPVAGALVGGIFGFWSFYRSTTPIFKNPVIAFGPRILIGVVAALVFAALQRRYARALAAAVLGAGMFTILGPGASRFEEAYAAGAIAPSWLIAAYHAVAAATVVRPWVAAAAGVAAAAMAYAALRGANAAPAAAAVAGTLTNTVGVLSLMVAFGYIPAGAAFVIGATHGLPEVVLAVVVTVPVCRAVEAARGR